MLEDANLDENYSGEVNPAERDETKAWGTSFDVGGVTYAASLFWQPLQNRDDPFVEIIEASENVLEGADLFCLKPGKSPQFGLCVSYQGYKKKMPAAAVSVSTALSDRSSFLAVFKVSNGWWYVCARNDIILSDGDMLFLNEEDAKEQFMSMLAVPDWGRKIAPEEWGLDDIENISLESLLEKGADAKLQKIRALRGPKGGRPIPGYRRVHRAVHRQRTDLPAAQAGSAVCRGGGNRRCRNLARFNLNQFSVFGAAEKADCYSGAHQAN